MLDILFDAFLDTLKLFPFLYVTFLFLEYVEHKLNKKRQQKLMSKRKIGPIIGGVLGGFPQCGFSSMGANLFSSKVITMGTLIAIFLSTSDEMFAIMLSEQVKITTILTIVGFKILVGIIIGLLVDLVYMPKKGNSIKEIESLCEEEHCHCNESLFVSALEHTLSTALYVLIANVVINLIISFVGTDALSKFLGKGGFASYFISSLIGLIPNCAASIVITEVYINNMISLGTLLSGLLTGSGIGILLLFKANKSLKENLTILGILYVTGVLIGIIVDLVI